MEIREFQRVMAEAYMKKDGARGIPGTYMWFMEEVGELATALREGTKEEQAGEFADVCAWLFSLANLSGIDMQEALKKYSGGCSGCHQTPCVCAHEKP